jgi:hypothetical protein
VTLRSHLIGLASFLNTLKQGSNLTEGDRQTLINAVGKATQDLIATHTDLEKLRRMARRLDRQGRLKFQLGRSQPVSLEKLSAAMLAD